MPTGRPSLAVVGATGTVGRVLLGLLSTRADVWGEVRLIASARSAGQRLAVRGVETDVQALSEEAFAGVDLAVFDVPGPVAAQWVPIAAAKGVVVIDRSARWDEDVPLVVPEVNAPAARIRPRGVIASPGCATLTAVLPLGALHAEYGLRELVLASYQAASADGQAGVAALREQLALVAGGSFGEQTGDLRAVITDNGPFPAPLALNTVPWAGEPAEGGWSAEELRLRTELRRVLGLPELAVSATCVRVPVLTGHSMAVHAVFEREVEPARAAEILRDAPGVVLYDDPAAGEYPTPNDVVGTDPVWAGRLRRSPDDACALDLFLCGDNLRKGAALNLLQTAELVAAEYS